MAAGSRLSLRRLFQVRVAWREHRLAFALAWSILAHATIFLALAFSTDGSPGTEHGHVVKSALYAVLRSSFAATETASPAVLHDAGADDDAGNDKQIALREKLQARHSETKKGERNVDFISAPRAATKSEASTADLQSVPRYLSGIELQRQPNLLNDISIVYPIAAGTQEGKVTLRILISETGAIDGMAVMRAEPKGFFEDAALSAFARAEFSPGEVLGRPVKSQYFVEVEFVPINRGETSGKAY